MAWICVTVLQRCSGFLTECKKLGAQEQRGVGQQKGRKQRQDGGTGINRELVQGKRQDGGALCAIEREDAR